MLTDNSFERLSDPITGVAESVTLRLLRRIKRIAQILAADPETVINLRETVAMARDEHEEYVSDATQWVDEKLPAAYVRGIKETDGTINSLDIEASPDSPIRSGTMMAGSGGGGSISATASNILDDYPNHHTMYSAFQDAAYRDFNRTLMPVVRDVEDKVREIVIQASESQYREAETFTRRQMSQDLMRRFADENITGIQYADGRTMKLDSYSEMVARTQTGNAARQASMNRQQEYGFDLVRISTHYPCSDLCVDWQGGVYSISGNHDHYPALDDAISGGLYHSNCKHFQNGYFPGVSPKQEVRQQELGKRKNRERYELTQRQRTVERRIRKYKRREATAMTDDARDKAKAKVREWQKANRELVEGNDFLRRKYFRESING